MNNSQEIILAQIVDTLETQHPTYTSIQFLLSKAIGK